MDVVVQENKRPSDINEYLPQFNLRLLIKTRQDASTRRVITCTRAQFKRDRVLARVSLTLHQVRILLVIMWSAMSRKGCFIFTY